MKSAAIAVTLAFAAGFGVSAFAQPYPSRPLTIVVPFPAGGPTDTLARILSETMRKSLGQPVVIENRPGANMIIGAEAAARAAPDGYTLLIAHDGTMAMNPVVYRNLSYHPQRDFEPVALLTSIPEALLVHEALPARSVGELIALARERPGKLNHATGGTATLLALELFKAMAGIDVTSVPFRGGAPAVTAVMAGEVQMIFADLATAHAGMASGRLRTLAVTTRERVARLPEVPTMHESGVPGYDVATWIAAFAPAGTPPAIVSEIGAGMRRALAAPDVRDKLEALNMQVRGGSGEELRALLAADIAKWDRLVKERNIRIAQ